MFGNKLIRSIRKGKFMPVQPNLNQHFCPSDSEEQFNENLKSQPDDWYYRTNQVTYRTNSDNYRTEEFKKIDWAESVVVLGCSFVYGAGLDEADTLSSQLSLLLDRPVVNLGVIGASPTLVLHNSVILASHYPQPKAVIHVWPDHCRSVYYSANDVANYGPWNSEQNSFGEAWARDDDHGKVSSVLASMTAKQIWKERYYETAYLLDIALPLNFPPLIKLKPKDWSRDLRHPGRKTTQQVAEKIAKTLCLTK